jgi:hypothetical protein
MSTSVDDVEMVKDGPSDRLASLMNLAKGRTVETGGDVATPQAIGAALDWCYGGTLSLRDALHHAVAAWREAGKDGRYEMGRGDPLDLLLAPINGPSSIELLGPSSLDTQYTVGQFYGAILLRIMGDLQTTRCDWCRTRLDDARVRAEAWAAKKAKRAA